MPTFWEGCKLAWYPLRGLPLWIDKVSSLQFEVPNAPIPNGAEGWCPTAISGG